MNIQGLCTASPINNGYGAITPTDKEKLDFCTNENGMKKCPRFNQFLELVVAINKGPHISSFNTNTITNTNTLNLSQNFEDDFELARATVEAKNDISQDEKDLINGRLLILEREIAKGKEKIDKSKIQRIREGFEKYSWLVPIIIDIIKKGLE